METRNMNAGECQKIIEDEIRSMTLTDPVPDMEDLLAVPEYMARPILKGEMEADSEEHRKYATELIEDLPAVCEIDIMGVADELAAERFFTKAGTGNKKRLEHLERMNKIPMEEKLEMVGRCVRTYQKVIKDYQVCLREK